MSKSTLAHSKLITEAARTVLRPMGLFQKGRSRFWMDDQRWWICGVEFQPSSWSRGSYLNVGCCWLWIEKDQFTFDTGYRVEGFVGYKDDEQFRPEAFRLAERAAEEVAHYRQLFPNINEVCKHCLQQDLSGLWAPFHAAVACALAGNPDEARRLFRRVLDIAQSSWPANTDWVTAAQADAAQLATIASDSALFRQIVVDRVHRTRDLQKLPTIATVGFAQ